MCSLRRFMSLIRIWRTQFMIDPVLGKSVRSLAHGALLLLIAGILVLWSFPGEAQEAQRNDSSRELFIKYVRSCRDKGQPIKILDRFGESFKGIDISGLDLKGVDFRGVHFQGVNVRGSDLSGSDLRESDLYLGDFRNARMNGVDLTGAMMDRCDLSHSDLRGAKGVASKRMPTASIDLRGSILSGIDLRGADLKMAQLDNADLSRSDLRGAVLAGASLTGVKIDGARMDQVILLNVHGIRDRAEEFSRLGAIATVNDLERAVRTGVNLRKADFSCTNLTGANLQGALLDEAWFHTASLNKIDLSSAHLSKAFFCFSKMEEANLEGATLDGASLSSVKLTRARLARANLKGASLHSSILVDADLSNAILTGADLSFADLRGAVLENVDTKHLGIDGAITKDLKGISQDRASALHWRAAQWKVELAEGIENLLNKYFWRIFILLGVIVFLGGCISFKKAWPSSKLVALLFADCAFMAGPIARYLLSVSGGSNVAQISSAGPWHFWFSAWPILTLLSCGGIIVCAVVILYQVVENLIPRKQRNWSLLFFFALPTLLFGFLALWLLGSSAPDA